MLYLFWQENLQSYIVWVILSALGTIITSHNTRSHPFFQRYCAFFWCSKLERSNLANALSFNVFQNTSHCETNLLSKQLYFQSNIDLSEMRDFCRETFYRIPSCLELLLHSCKHFLVKWIFLIRYILNINTFSAQLLFRKSFFSKISNYSEYLLFRSRHLLWTPPFFQKRNLFRSRYFLKKVTSSDGSV